MPREVPRGEALKASRGCADSDGMRAQELSCPICNADVPVDGDERPGEQVFCAYCRAPLILVPGKGDDEYELEDDL